MADFMQKTNVKSAVRKLANPIADINAFNTIVQTVITNNPFGCVSYMTSGVNHPPVEKSKETYTAKFVYQDSNAKSVGSSLRELRYDCRLYRRYRRSARQHRQQHGAWGYPDPRCR